ncbi:TetR/AcrR family transcriptional regulator [Phocaeicola coprocola]|jgi:AcrR family transcriptional regulator|uniref:TetR/AcrR family transcriptional regulator n=1 Tax=Phocaeicola coprocola TaxID=310298 RepID=UPI00266F7508|nr:TetR/AcrR family transcriptional regulator [Phocaeicola coprocola]
MKNYDIDRILLPAFKLFLTYNYERVSTSKLEEETGLTRGAIFFKHKTKESLFKAVIDRYILQFQSESSNIQAESLKEYIDLYLEGIEIRMEQMQSLGIANVHRSYFNLLYQALQYYPDFSDKVTEMFCENIKKWEEIVSAAKESGEIKSICDIHKTAVQFKYIYSGMAFEYSLNRGLDVNELRKIYYAYYNEIANKEDMKIG